MKTFKRLLMFLASAIVACNAFALVGCSETSVHGVEVSDNEWMNRLSVLSTGIDSVTVSLKYTSPYPIEQAAEYGGWSDDGLIVKADYKNEIVYAKELSEIYGTEGDLLCYNKAEVYYLKYKNSYYGYSSDIPYSTEIFEITRDIFLECSYIADWDAIDELFDLSDPANKANFTYNTTTNSYETIVKDNAIPCSSDSASYSTTISICFLNNDDIILTYTLYKYNIKDTITEIKVTDINRTEVSVPDSVYTNIDEYIGAFTEFD